LRIILLKNRTLIASPLTPTTSGRSRKEVWLIVISFSITYFVWGSTYLANAWAVHSIPPFLLAGSRFTIAGLFMYVLGRVAGQERVSRKHWRNGLFAGLLMFVVGNGAMVWALQYIESGILAMIVAFEPLIVVGFLRMIRRRKPGAETLAGIALGIFGMALLVGQPDFVSNPKWVIALVVMFFGITAWAYVSVYLVDADLPKSPFQTSAIQMLPGGLILLAISFFAGDFSDFHLRDVPERAWWSMIYLIIGGSVLAFTAYNFLVRTVSPEKVVTNTYVNPVVALFLGWWLNAEKISGQSLIASALLIGGVFLINLRLLKRNNF